MSQARYWYISIAYAILFASFYISKGLSAVSKAGDIEVPFAFKGIWIVVFLLLGVILEVADRIYFGHQEIQ